MQTKRTRPANAVEVRASQNRESLPPPEDCSEDFKAEWLAITGSFEPGFFRACDRTVLEQRVKCALELREVQRIVDNLPSRYVQNSAGTLVQHPACRDLESLRARFRALCIATRTAPGTRLDVHQVGKEPPSARDDGDNDPKLARLREAIA
jgi:hypothetical protein